MTNKERILSLIRGINRPSMDAVASYMENSSFFSINCRGHHFTGQGGVAEHSLEVLDYMLSHNTDGLSEDSITLLALCHDLGKCGCAHDQFTISGHDRRSLKALESCGVILTAMERDGIITHSHDYPLNQLGCLLEKADEESAKAWQKAHPSEMAAKRAAKAAKRAAKAANSTSGHVHHHQHHKTNG